MNFNLCRPVKILLLGAGGTGGYVAPHLYRLMHTLNRPVRINIVDGDLVEAQNLVRQNFCAADLGENKAKVLATRYSEAFGMETLYHLSLIHICHYDHCGVAKPHPPLDVGDHSRGEGAVVKKGKGRTRYSQSYQNVVGHRFVAVEQQIKQKPHRRRSDKVRQVIGRTEKFHSPNAVEGEQG